MGKRPTSYADTNLPKLEALCKREGYEIEHKGVGHYRVYAATHVIDFWVARMKYHRIMGETINSKEPYHDTLDAQFNADQVTKLLATGAL